MSCGREEFPRVVKGYSVVFNSTLQGRNKISPDPSSGYVTGEEEAPILLVRSAKCVWIPAKTVHGNQVTVPPNSTDINIQPVNNGNLDEAVSGIYRHKTQEKAKYLTILYCNLSENYIV